MKSQCYSVQHQYEPSNLEVTEIAITSQESQINSSQIRPRHTNALESQSHRGFKNYGIKTRTLPKLCQIDLSLHQTTTNTAIDILKYQLNDRFAKQNHLNSVRRNLEKRIKTAKAINDKTLIDLLEAEFEQLEIEV
jgi:hypothetical protein